MGHVFWHVAWPVRAIYRAGYFKSCAGVIIGDMSRIKINDPNWGSSIEATILEILKDTKVPVAFGFPAGHELENRALYFGRNVRLEVTKSITRVLFID